MGTNPLESSPNRYKVLPSHNSSKPRVRICFYADLVFAVPSPRLENIKLMAINNDLGFGFVIPDS